MSTGRIIATRDGHIARLTIDHVRRRNAMTLEMWRELGRHCREIAADREVRVVVLAGAGELAFCAGADISEFKDNRSSEAAVETYDQAVADASRALASLPKPTIALIKGVCFGGGMGLAMSCDVRLASSTARFRIPAAKLGLGYPFESLALLVQKLGPGTVADILYSARVVTAEEAQRLHITQITWPEAEFDQSANNYVQQIAANAPLTLAAVKAALVELSKAHGAVGSPVVEEMVKACFSSADYQEGQNAFREKREPRFRGN
jgi:enoyl-CoA hydratase/carnithine racemase